MGNLFRGQKMYIIYPGTDWQSAGLESPKLPTPPCLTVKERDGDDMGICQCIHFDRVSIILCKTITWYGVFS